MVWDLEEAAYIFSLDVVKGMYFVSCNINEDTVALMFIKMCMKTGTVSGLLTFVFAFSLAQLKGKGLSGTFTIGKQPLLSKVCYSRGRKGTKYFSVSVFFSISVDTTEVKCSIRIPSI